jgi:protein-tyrosine phosphatase
VAFTELHFHLLPGIDDGPTSLEESVALAAAAAADGTGTIVATPHVNRVHNLDVGALPERVREVRDRLRRERIDIDVLCGAELAHHRVPALSQAELETIAQGPAGGRWLLLEASLQGLDGAFTAAADELRARGFAVVMAHPERALAPAGAEAFRLVEHELAAGSAMQINAWSLTGRYGETVRRLALRVLDTAAVAVVASDAHGRSRPPSLTPALTALSRAGDPQGECRAGQVPQRLLTHGLPARPALAA